MPAPIVSDSVVSGIRKFLEALNSSGGTPIEQLCPKDARQVLIDAQNSVQQGLRRDYGDSLQDRATGLISIE